MVPMKFHEYGEMTMAQNSKKALDNFDINQPIDFSTFHNLFQEATSGFEEYCSYSKLKKEIETTKNKNYDVMHQSIQKDLYCSYFSKFYTIGVFLHFVFISIVLALRIVNVENLGTESSITELIIIFIIFIIALIIVAIPAFIFTLPLYFLEEFKMSFINRNAPNFSKKSLYSFSILFTILLAILVFLEVKILQAIFPLTIISSITYLLLIVISIFISNALPFIRMKKFKKHLKEKSEKKLEEAAEKDRDAIKQATKQLQALRAKHPEFEQKAQKEIYEIMKDCVYIYLLGLRKSSILERNVLVIYAKKWKEDPLKLYLEVMHIIADLKLSQYDRYSAINGQTFDMWCKSGIEADLSEGEKFWRGFEQRHDITPLDEEDEKLIIELWDDFFNESKN